MKSKRQGYGQYCGLARALDLVGERWSLLVVRELLIGPARYGELRRRVGGIATNLLADRLEALGEAGVVERVLDEGSRAVLYRLTDLGLGLREPIEALIRWSTPLMAAGPGGDQLQPQWLVVALRALLAGRRPPPGRPPGGRRQPSRRLAVVAGGGTLVVSVAPAGFEVGVHRGEAVDATVRLDAADLLAVAAGARPLPAGARVEGDAGVLAAVLG